MERKARSETIKTISSSTFGGWRYGGELDDYTFEAKVCSVDSMRGIKYGHVMKLFVYEKKSSKEVAVYQYGWDMYPKTPEIQMLTERIIDHLEQLAKAENNKA